MIACKVVVNESSDLQSNVPDEFDEIATLAFSTWHLSEFRLVQLKLTSQSSVTYPVSNVDRTKRARLDFTR